MTLTALTFATETEHRTDIEDRAAWTSNARQRCSPNIGQSLDTPTAATDLAMRIHYLFASIDAGQSKTVKYEYGRM